MNHLAPLARMRFNLSHVAVAALCALATNAHALGLGRLNVQSALGETLKAEIELSSLSAEEASSLRVRVAAPDAYRASGLEYNAVLPGTQVQLARRPDGRPVLRLVSDRAVQEPFLDVVLELNWSTGRLTREFTLLFDPPQAQRAARGAHRRLWSRRRHPVRRRCLPPAHRRPAQKPQSPRRAASAEACAGARATLAMARCWCVRAIRSRAWPHGTPHKGFRWIKCWWPSTARTRRPLWPRT